MITQAHLDFKYCRSFTLFHLNVQVEAKVSLQTQETRQNMATATKTASIAS